MRFEKNQRPKHAPSDNSPINPTSGKVAGGLRQGRGGCRGGCLRGGDFCGRSLDHFRYGDLFSGRFNGDDRRRLQSLDGRRQFDRVLRARAH